MSDREGLYRDTLVRIEEVVGRGAPDIITANTLLGRVKQLVQLALASSENGGTE